MPAPGPHGPNRSTPAPPSPDVPAAARLMEAARSYRLLAAKLRGAHPPQRASSQHAQVDVAADGRVLGLRVLSSETLRGRAVGAHLHVLYRAAIGDESSRAENVVVGDLEPDQAPVVTALGPRRFTFPPGVDDAAPPALAMEQLRTRVRRRLAAAEASSRRVTDLTGEGVAAEGNISIIIQSGGQLASVSTTSWIASLPLEALNSSLEQALEQARHDVTTQMDHILTQGELR